MTVDREPNAQDALAYVGMKIAEWTSYAIIVYALCKLWGATS